MSDVQKNIVSKLINIQSKLVCGKSQYNSFGGYSYRSCEDILEAAKPLLEEEGLAIILNDEIIQINDRYYVKATATLWDTETNVSLCSTAYAREEESKKGMDASQVTGAASSYARKYALNGLFAIDDVKDSDTTNTHEKTTVNPQKEKTNTQTPTKPKTPAEPVKNEAQQVCEVCGGSVTDKVAKYSKDKFDKVLCFDCQKKPKNEIKEEELPF